MNSDNITFEEGLDAYKTDKSPLYKRDIDMEKLKKLIDSKK